MRAGSASMLTDNFNSLKELAGRGVQILANPNGARPSGNGECMDPYATAQPQAPHTGNAQVPALHEHKR